MPSVEFFHKRAPLVNAGSADVCIKAYQVGGGEMVIIDDEEGGDSHTVDAAAGATAYDQARPGTVALIVDIAGRRGLSIVAGDVSEVPEP